MLSMIYTHEIFWPLQMFFFTLKFSESENNLKDKVTVF